VLEEEVFGRQPPGFESEKYPHQVYKLRKALYGLKQAPRAWYGRFRKFLFERGFKMGKIDQTHVPLQCDSTSAISVAKNPVLHSKTKHIEVRYHFLRDNVEKEKIALIHVPTNDQLADIFTKPLDQEIFTRLRGSLLCV
jgi:hypothetical protein